MALRYLRGETQALAVVTLGTSDDEQRIDALEESISGHLCCITISRRLAWARRKCFVVREGVKSAMEN